MKRRTRKKKECDICGRTHIKRSPRQCVRQCLLEALKTAMDLRDGGQCQKCGTICHGTDSHMSHVYRVSQCGRLKFDLQNVKTLCAKCHLGWWHLDEVEAGVWFAQTFPERWAYLRGKRNEYRTQQGTIPMGWYRQRLEELRSYIRNKGGVV